MGGHAHFLFHEAAKEVAAIDDLAASVRDLAGPLAAEADVDLVDVQVKGTGPRRLVRVMVDRKGGVDLATCQEVSRRLSAALDEHDPIAERYSLEVTSPGTSHPLHGQRAFERVEGRGVLVQRRSAGDDRVEQVRGTVRDADADVVVLDVDGDEVRVPYGEIVKATQTLPW